uniref:Integrin beta n=1 Tax=Tetranychus urticae TaxID=32264 RepID=T1K854_TETUR
MISNGELDKCNGEPSCGQCIRSSTDCGWCSAENYDSFRCALIGNLNKLGCRNESIEFPKNKMEIKQNRELSWAKAASINEAVQIKPQLIKLTLRPKKYETVKMFYRQAVDYPVDLYYLMDVSKTMSKHKQKLAELGNELANQMGLITKNFRLGFGSFIDKNIQPFTDTNPQKLKKPCDECSSSYGFKHSMSLDTNVTKFIKLVKESPISGNIDAPEGTLDAIMQAIVCRERIGWRKDARHLLIVTTDADYHYAGDGRLAGLIKPNDEECHLDSQNFYSAGNEQDYPSINQINMVSQENNVHIIFSIIREKIAKYGKLVKKIKSASLAELSSNSANIVDIIKGEYQKLTSNIQLVDNSSDHLRLTYYSSCLKKGISDDNLNLVQPPICEGLQVDSQVMFKVKIELISCPNRVSERKEVIKINPIGLEEGLIIEVNMICECDCEKTKETKKHISKCNSKGDYICGKCNCHQGSFGSDCACDGDDRKSFEECFKDTNDTEPCSGRGVCKCGECKCYSVKGHAYTGKYCQCDDLACEYVDGQICGGITRGECKCGKCECTDRYTGSVCECPKSSQKCIDPVTKTICNGRGTCNCGKCDCQQSYFGLYCDECPTCLGQCPLYQDLIKQQINNGTLEMTSSLTLTSTNYSIISTLVNDLKEDSRDKRCQFVGKDDDCAYMFTYRYEDETLIKPSLKNKISENQRVIMKALKIRKCTQPIDLKAYAAEYIGTIVVIGLITLLIWRIITFMLDRHEYQKFLKACANIDFPEVNSSVTLHFTFLILTF